MPLDLNLFRDVFPKNILLENEPMSAHTSFRTGGTAALMLVPDSTERLIQAVALCRENNIDYYIVGKCTNLLVRDGGYPGVIIKIEKDLAGFSFYNGIHPDMVYVNAEAGILLSDLSGLACERGLTGLEFASGIPGTLGGAVCMNAGAYDGELKDILINACLLTEDGSIIKLSGNELGFGYRTSIIQTSGYVVLSAVVALQKSDKQTVRDRVDELTALRNQKQPIDQPSAGSTFKRPQGYFTGKLITDAGLKGYSIGGAKVSEKHAGFIVNYNAATANDIIRLIDHVILTVKERFGVTLEPEVKIIGYDTAKV